MSYKHAFGPFAPEVYRMPMAYPFRWPTGPDRCGEEAAAEVVSLIDSQLGGENVACVVIEPIQGEGFLPRLADYCRANGIVLVADEIQTGFGRTGRWFACEHEQVVPDLVTTAKGIAGGLPLSAVTGRAEIMDSVHCGGLGGTFGGNPVCCAAALGAIRTIEEEDLVGAARRIGETMLPRLRELQRRFPVIGDVRGRGAMVAVELVGPGTKQPEPDAAKAVAQRCHAQGLVVLTCGTYGNVLRFLPPLVIGDRLLGEGLAILEEAFADLGRPVPRAPSTTVETPA